MDCSDIPIVFPEAAAGGRGGARAEGGKGYGRGLPGGGVAERAERGLLVRSVAPVAEWLRWDGGGGHWGSWRLGSPQRERGSRALERRGSEGQDYRHRMLPAGWCQAPGRPIATLLPGQGAEDGEVGEEEIGRAHV